jgi:hypothetical protein
MTGYDAFCSYMAVKLHFTTEKFDYFRYQGKYTRISVEKFEQRKDRYFFHKLSRQYPTHDELTFFLAANFFSRKTVWVRDLLTEEARECYFTRKRVKESLGYMVTQDLATLGFSLDTVRGLLRVPQGEYPTLLQAAMIGQIRDETLIVLCAALGCWETWSTKITDTIIYPAFRHRCERYAPFLAFDVHKFRHMLKTRLDKSYT